MRILADTFAPREVPQSYIRLVHADCRSEREKEREAKERDEDKENGRRDFQGQKMSRGDRQEESKTACLSLEVSDQKTLKAWLKTILSCPNGIWDKQPQTHMLSLVP